MPTIQAHAGKNAPYEKVKSYSSPWLSKPMLRSPHEGGQRLKVFANQLLSSWPQGPAWFGQPNSGRDKYLPSVYSFKWFFRSKPFMALAMQTSPGLGCISFSSRLPVKMSRTLMRPLRAGRTMRVSTNGALAV